MLPDCKQLFVSLFKKLRSLTGFVEKIILATLSFILGFLFLINGGVDPGKHAFLVPAFGFLIFLHGLYVYLRDKSKRREGDYELSTAPLKYVPFLIWAIISVNIISPVPWIGQIYLIYFFEAFVVFWIIGNHLKVVKQLVPIFVGLFIPLLIHLYIGFDQFFHRNSLSELGEDKIVSGLFFESNSYVFLCSIFIAGLAPGFGLKYWENGKRFLVLSIFLLLLLGLIIANNFQGFLMLLFACLCLSCFAFYNNKSRIKFLISILVITGFFYLVFSASFTSFEDYYFTAFSYGDVTYFFTAWIASLFLFFKNCLIGVGLAGFEAKLYTIQPFNFPLIVSNPNSFYLLMLSELGIFGAILLSKPLLIFLIEKYHYLKAIPKWVIVDRRRRVPVEKVFVSILLSAVTTFLFICLFHSVIIIPFFLCLFAALIGVLNLNLGPSEYKIIKDDTSISRKLTIRKNTKDAKCYFAFACLLAVLFSYDGYKVLKSQGIYENANAAFEIIFKNSDNLKEEKLLKILNQVEDSINENKQNLDAWLLKNKISHVLINKNPIRFKEHLDLMLESSQFVLDREKNYWYAWTRHGISLTLNGDFKEAEDAFIRSIQLAPNNFETNFYMGSYLMNFNERMQEAEEYIIKALLISPANQEALALLQKLKL